MNNTYTGTIYGINGPVVYIKGKTAFKMGEMVFVGPEKLVGEIIALTSDITTIQVIRAKLFSCIIINIWSICHTFSPA